MKAGDLITVGGVQYRVEEITVDGDTVQMLCRTYVEETPEAQNRVAGGPRPSARPALRSYTHSSAYVRLWHENRMVVGVLTHCTDRAVRIVAPEGAAWLPKNVMDYASTSKNPEGFFCVTADDYVPVFVEPSPSMPSTVEDTCGAWEIYSEEFLQPDMVNVPNDENEG